MELSKELDAKKSHRKPQSGKKFEKKKAKNEKAQDLTPQQRNPKAFAVRSAIKAQRNIARTEDLKNRKHHIPVVNRTPLQPPPVLVAIIGGPKVGKTTLMKGLIKHYTKRKINQIIGPVTVVANKKRRLSFIEVNNEINCMVDIAKVADVVLVLIDITIGYEMECFEFLEICRAYGSPKIMGVLNHIDLMKNNKSLKKLKKQLTRRFEKELYPGAKLFYIKGMLYGEYLRRDIINLGRFISVFKLRPLHFRLTHPYVLVDRMEDITNAETIRKNPTCSRNVVLYGYMRGIPMHLGQRVHIPGVGDHRIKELTILDDPCPLPGELKKRSLNSTERILYAPMSGLSGFVYDKDAIYIDLVGGPNNRRKPGSEAVDPVDAGEEPEPEPEEKGLMTSLLDLKKTTDEKREESHFQLFSNSQPLIEMESDTSDEEEEEGHAEKEDPQNRMPRFEVTHDKDGRRRRRVVFEDELLLKNGNQADDNESGEDSYDDCSGDELQGNEDDEDNEDKLQSDDEDEAEEEFQPRKKLRKDDSSELPLPGCSQTPGVLKKEEEKLVESTQIDLNSSTLPGLSKVSGVTPKSYVKFLHGSIYGDGFSQTSALNPQDDDDDDDENDVGGLFRPLDRAKRQSNRPGGLELDGLDSCRLPVSGVSRDWSSSEMMDSIRERFVTGNWGEMGDAEKLLKLDDEDEDLYGDFEDLETGEKVAAEKKEEKTETDQEKDDSAKTRLEKKRELKEFFNAHYDDKVATEQDYWDIMKEEMNKQADLNRTQFEGLEEETRVVYEGFRAGLYVRMEFEDMDSELVTNFDPAYPLIVGGLLDHEMKMGFIKVRLKVHRWAPRILKNRDPVYLSLGWRRFQVLMFYGKRDDNFRLRALKYARKYLHVEAVFWGPVTEMSSGFVAFQNINQKTNEFSIAATGVVLEADKSTTIVKKLKLIGYPEKVYPKTAFIKGMFHSEMEVAKFGGVKIHTQSSIRGTVKKAIGQNGLFRASFEDTIKMSDIVILTTWVPVEIPTYCSIVKNLLLPINHKCEWPGMKTTAQIKRERNIKNPPNLDSMYTDITERSIYVHKPLKIPRILHKALPYEFKPKNLRKMKLSKRIAVVKDPEEVKLENFMNELKVMMNERMEKRKLQKERKSKKFVEKIKMMNATKEKNEKKKKASICRKLSLKRRKR